jgi:hypothetical protein
VYAPPCSHPVQPCGHDSGTLRATLTACTPDPTRLCAPDPQAPGVWLSAEQSVQNSRQDSSAQSGAMWRHGDAGRAGALAPGCGRGWGAPRTARAPARRPPLPPGLIASGSPGPGLPHCTAAWTAGFGRPTAPAPRVPTVGCWSARAVPLRDAAGAEPGARGGPGVGIPGGAEPGADRSRGRRRPRAECSGERPGSEVPRGAQAGAPGARGDGPFRRRSFPE